MGHTQIDWKVIDFHSTRVFHDSKSWKATALSLLTKKTQELHTTSLITMVLLPENEVRSIFRYIHGEESECNLNFKIIHSRADVCGMGTKTRALEGKLNMPVRR